MSFILDALKKSESERQRQSGPALFEVKVAPPRRRVGPWVSVLAGLLVVNLAIVGWVLSRGTSTPGPRAEHEPVGAPSGSGSRSAAGPQAGVAAPAPQPRGVRSSGSARPAAKLDTAAGPPSVASKAAGPSGAAETDPNPADYAPAVEPQLGTPVTGGGSVSQQPQESLPTYRQAASLPGANLPALHLDLHVYARRSGERFVFVNRVKLREGQSLPDGARVDRITPNGVIMSYEGERFLLRR